MWGIYSQVRMANEVIEEAHGACISGLKEATQRTKRSNVAKGQIQKASIQVKGEREYVRRQELLYYRLSEAMDAHLEEEAACWGLVKRPERRVSQGSEALL